MLFSFKRQLRFILVACAIFVLGLSTVAGGCAKHSIVHYLGHVSIGHIRIMLAKKDIDSLLHNNDGKHIDQHTRQKLLLVQEVRSFAIESLGLPDDAGFRSFVELDRNTLGWNVYATSRFSVEPHTWCFPFVGCVVYRGYFSQAAAQDFVHNLQKKDRNTDVWITPFSGYSSLGYFEDPLLSTQITQNDASLASVIIHEIAHQQLYIPGKSHINEAFATFVEHKGVMLWLTQTQRFTQLQQYQDKRKKRNDRIAKIRKAKESLHTLFTSQSDKETMLATKAHILANLESDLCTQCTVPITPENTTLNNAFFIPYATYFDHVHAMEKLFIKAGKNFPKFYALVEETYATTQQ